MEGVFIDRGGAVVNVKHSDFAPPGGRPAQGDGRADDTEALRRAIAWAEAQYDATGRALAHTDRDRSHHGVLLYFPPGRYRVTGTLMLRRPLRLLGAGYNESMLVTEANAPVLHFEPTMQAPMTRARIERLGFEGSHVYRRANTAISGQDGVRLTKYPGTRYGNTLVEIEACQFARLGGAGIHGYFAEAGNPHAAGDKFAIHGCHIEGCGDYGIRLEGRHSTAYITRNHITLNAGGIALLGTDRFPVASSRVLDNIIEANDGGPDGVPAGGDQKPFVGVMLREVNFCEVRGNYFEWHLNGVYAGAGCRNVTVARNWFDGNDVAVPKWHHDATRSFITRRLSPVHVEPGVISVVIEENDCYLPAMPQDADRGSPETWSPRPHHWERAYEVFPDLEGSQHELIRNSARLIGGRRQDVTYAARAADRVFFESLQWITPEGDVVQHRERVYRRGIEARELLHLKAGAFQHEGAASGVVHTHVYPAGGPAGAAAVRARGVLSERAGDGALAQKAELWRYTDLGFAFPPGGWSATGSDDALRRIDFGRAAPDRGSGAWVRGSIRFNEAPVEAGPAGQRYTVLGWRCVADGTPGTWVEMRTLTGD